MAPFCRFLFLSLSLATVLLAFSQSWLRVNTAAGPPSAGGQPGAPGSGVSRTYLSFLTSSLTVPQQQTEAGEAPQWLQ